MPPPRQHLGHVDRQLQRQHRIRPPYFTSAAYPSYGWLGGKQRSRNTLSGLTLMGVRLYDPNTGRFLQTDPIPGGSANPYDYTNQDPYNKYDLNGQFSCCWCKKVGKKIQSAGRWVASNKWISRCTNFAPGYLGMVCGGAQTLGYAVNMRGISRADQRIAAFWSYAHSTAAADLTDENACSWTGQRASAQVAGLRLSSY